MSQANRAKLKFLGIAGTIITTLVVLTVVLSLTSFYNRVFGYSPKNDSPIHVKVPKVTSIDHSQDRVEAKAIPVIFYHGILPDSQGDNVNTTESNFVSQMADLKKAGYYTIDTQTMIDFYAGKKKLYGRPILITFDDGRKDSWINADDALRQLHFKAVMFVVTGKQDTNDPFFLSWKQLGVMYASGRWDLQAHGWFSHTKIPIDSKGDASNPLTNRKWISDQYRLETITEADSRITYDYTRSISDLKSHFPSISVESFAVPFGDFGQTENNFANYPSGEQLNNAICQQFFKVCFIIDNEGYNFVDQNPDKTVRLAVAAGWSGDDLMYWLKRNAPDQPNLNQSLLNGKDMPTPATAYQGVKQTSADGLLLSSAPGQQYINLYLGNENDHDYNFTATYKLVKGNSLFLAAYKKIVLTHSLGANDQSSLLVGVSGDELILKEETLNQQTVINSVTLYGFDPHAVHNLSFAISGNYATVTLDGRVLMKNVALPPLQRHGVYGFDAWGQNGSQFLLYNYTVKPS